MYIYMVSVDMLAYASPSHVTKERPMVLVEFIIKNNAWRLRFSLIISNIEEPFHQRSYDYPMVTHC